MRQRLSLEWFGPSVLGNFFSRVHATLHAALLVRQSVHPSVGCCLQSARNLWRSALFIFAYFHTFWYVLVRNKEKWQIFKFQ